MNTQTDAIDVSGIKLSTKNKIIGLVKVLFSSAKIILYGSRARKTFHDRSDIDIALDAGNIQERLQLGEIRAILEAMSTPYRIDVVDVNFVTESLREAIKRDGVLWSE